MLINGGPSSGKNVLFQINYTEVNLLFNSNKCIVFLDFIKLNSFFQRLP